MSNSLILLPDVISAMKFIDSLNVSDTDEKVLAGRKFYDGFIPMAGAAEEIFAVEDRSIPSPEGNISIRIYRPSDQPLLPVTLYFHGGWFIAGGLDTHDRPLRTLARLSNSVIISVDYRLAPEYPFPHGLNDCCYALRWIVDNASVIDIDASCIALAGDSAGGALATVTARRAVKTMGIGVRCQVLIYPVADSSLSTPSWERYAEGPNLTLEGAQMAWSLYTPGSTERSHPDAAPLLADDLEDLPPTLIITAEHDPLRDEAVQYAQKLQSVGVNVSLSQYPGMIHGFFQMGGIIANGKQAIQEVAEFLINNASQQ